MPLNQLYHDRGVAQTRSQHGVTAEVRAKHTTEATRVDHRIRAGRADRAPAGGKSMDKFEIVRADEVQVSSTQFAGGDWRWRLADAAGKTLVEGRGYRTERACQVAVSLLRDRAFAAS